ncbi:hypothetical protein [Streptomyces sp. ST2-7A]|uniref:hypothetical protein n=1 Tax=Streptomyces sp. ST2-7A TaxID=2907214 RepID=UPI001F25691B|nr:hypothetical protein [Streptomyces sp. ST2-7A]MCE7082914.1 hypothetical protein [Streptomyces sp. ST2-7A]
MRWILPVSTVIVIALTVVRYLLSQVRELLLSFAGVISAWREMRRTLRDGAEAGSLPGRDVDTD